LLAIFDGNIEALESWILPTCHRDDDVLAAMARVHDEIGYFLDPHTAVGYLGLEEYRKSGAAEPGMILSTADPAKFPATVRRATGLEPPEREDWTPAGGGDAASIGAEATVRLGPDPDELRELLRSS
jgi:threonine synthase